MAKIALIVLSLLSTSVFASELDRPVQNVMDMNAIKNASPATIIVRQNEDTNQAEYAIIDGQFEGEAAIEAAKNANFVAVAANDSVSELDTVSAKPSFYFYFGRGRWVNPFFYGGYYGRGYYPRSYWGWNWGGWYYNCYRWYW